MAGDAFKKVKSGEPLTIPAEAWNAMLDAAMAHKTGLRTGARTSKGLPPHPGVVMVKNTSGATRGRFDALGIDEPIILPSASEQEFKSQISLKCVAPTTAHKGRFAILTEPLADGAIGRGIVAGATICRLNVGDADHEFADVDDTDPTALKTGDSGSARILWKESSTGPMWGVVRLGNPGATTDSGDCVARIAGLDLDGLDELSEAESAEDYALLALTAGGCLRKVIPQECSA